jgi:F420-dependent oxidoreductase-like protein
MAQVGLMIEGQWGLNWERWRNLLQAAEDYGFQCLFRSDHYTIGPPDEDSLETFISLTYAADHTKRIEFGTLVAPTTFRQPVLTARMGAQIDDLSGGRFILGLGTGWHEREHRQFGIPFYDIPTRYEMLEDALEITTRLYKSAEPVTYHGGHFSLNEAVLLPRPLRAGGPPIMIGGNGMKKTMPLAAKYASEWNAVYITVNEYRERAVHLNNLLAQNERDPASFKKSLMTQCIIGKDDAEVKAKLAGEKQPADKLLDWNIIAGTPSQIVEQIGRYSDAGCQRFMLMWKDQTDFAGLELLAKDVLPQVQS